MKSAEVNRIFSKYSEECKGKNYESVANIYMEGSDFSTEFCICAETDWRYFDGTLHLSTPQGEEYIDCEAIQRIAVKIEKN